MTDLPQPDYARNMRIVGHSDQGGRPDGVQIMVHRGYAYVGHMFSKGFSVVDVRDAKRPHAVNYLAAPPGTWNIHLQTHDDLLLVVNAKDMFAAAEFADEKGQLGKVVGTAEKKHATRDWTAGLAAYNRIRQPIGERIMLHGRKLGTHLGVNLRTDEERAMWKLLQDDRAMMDWIAVPNFLAAYR